MGLIKLSVKGISYSQTQSGAYALVLSEVEGERTLPIIIGAFEAQSIALALEKDIRTPRPLTHDLFKNFADKFMIKVKEVIIHKLVDGVFFSSLICGQGEVEEIIDSRTSDAIALAVRFKVPIFTYENILEKAGVYLQLGNKDQNFDELNINTPDLEFEIEDSEDDDFNQFSLQELHDNLNDAITNEDYELAARIRDEIDKRD